MLQGHTGEGAQDLSGMSGEGKGEDAAQKDVFYIMRRKTEQGQILELLYKYIKVRTELNGIQRVDI